MATTTTTTSTTSNYSTIGAFNLDDEASKIVLRSSIANGVATVSWNRPASGCTMDSAVYDGMMIVGSTSPIDLSVRPVAGQWYEEDPTLNPALFTGDKLGVAHTLFFGKQDPTTVTVDVTLPSAQLNYYFVGFPIDNVGQFGDPITSYSRVMKLQDLPRTDSYVDIEFKDAVIGDAPGLLTTEQYDFQVTYGTSTAIITIDPSVTPILSYQDLVNEINRQFALLVNPIVGVGFPNVGAFYMKSGKLYQWNGTTGVEQIAATGTVDPRSYLNWFDGTLLRTWNGLVWTPAAFTSTPVSLTTIPGGTIWFDGTTGYKYNSGIWNAFTTLTQATDPSLAIPMAIGSYWKSATGISQWVPFTNSCDEVSGMWTAIAYLEWAVNPSVAVGGNIWVDLSTLSVKVYDALLLTWVTGFLEIATDQPQNPNDLDFWYHTPTKRLYQWSDLLNDYTEVLAFFNQLTDPLTPTHGMYWFDTVMNRLWIYDGSVSLYKQVPKLYIQTLDPSKEVDFGTQVVGWWNPTTSVFSMWDGSKFAPVVILNQPTDPSLLVAGQIVYNSTLKTWATWNGAAFTDITASIITQATDPQTPTFWINAGIPYGWNGLAWVALALTNPIPNTGAYWYNPATGVINQWDGNAWVVSKGLMHAEWVGDTLRITSHDAACNRTFGVRDGSFVFGVTLGLFTSTTPVGVALDVVLGADFVDGTPMQDQMGVGTTGDGIHRLELIKELMIMVGYPAIGVELDQNMVNACVDRGLEKLRQRSSAGYERVFFFIDTRPGQQMYTLSNACVGFNRVVDVMAVYRMNASFLAKGEGQSVYGQLVMQNLYGAGKFDLVSYHLMSEYMSLLEIVTAGRMTFNWYEHKRQLGLHQTIRKPERMLLDAVIERTEQELIQDRWTGPWIRNWALAEMKLILANIRGKYQSFNGPSGSISLNSSDLIQQAAELKEMCLKELDEYVVSQPEDYGMGSQLVIG